MFELKLMIAMIIPKIDIAIMNILKMVEMHFEHDLRIKYRLMFTIAIKNRTSSRSRNEPIKS